jgi:deferrochelatase/peroxidase EfeB
MADPALDYSDIQGTILRGYRVDMARHFILSITDAGRAATLIGALVDGAGGLPKITTAARWMVKPECFVNIAFTAAGLAKLGVTSSDLKTFDAAFRRGATDPQSTTNVGDTGESAPANWIGGLGDAAAVHAVLSLWVDDQPQILESETARLREAFTGCLAELSVHDAAALPDNMVHFGYRDNIAQPTVIGAPPRKRPDPDAQPDVPTGEFLLGYTNATPGIYSVSPAPLSKNSSYAAFRILEQDVAGFEALLAEQAPKAGMDVEMLAAKFCGRWRNGNPLELSPDAPGTVLPDVQLNDFHYKNAGTPADDDTLGLRCPIGSHIRRNNPRDALVNGTNSTHHRIVRRAMPYGPAFDPARPDATPRGLIGYFINASISNQFEFLSSQWNLLSNFVKADTGPGGKPDGNAVNNISGQDPFLGVNDPATSSFTLPVKGPKSGNTVLKGFGRTVTTRGSAYVFLPSITGLRYLAALPATAAAAATA